MNGIISMRTVPMLLCMSIRRKDNMAEERCWCERLAAVLSRRSSRIHGDSDGFRRAAVLIPLVRTGDSTAILFEVRSKELLSHAGEICFPGGRIEAADCDICQAALRETKEELNIAAERVRLLGAMDMVASPTGNILYPVVGVLDSMDGIKPNQEVAEYFTVPLPYLLTVPPKQGKLEMATRPLNRASLGAFPAEYELDWKSRRLFPVFSYQYEERVIWGLTAGVLHNFIALCQDVGIE